MALLRGLSRIRSIIPAGFPRSKFLGMNASNMSTAEAALAGADPEQARLMSEQVILVDREDVVTGAMSKVDSHLVSNDLPLHRAFSLFLFDTQGRMLLQKRASTKVTFPSHWTNAVCSHPLSFPAELGELDGGIASKGAARAAVRKISHELGAQKGDLIPNDLLYLTRIHYRAESAGGVWGEHEMDYVFFAQKDIALIPQPNEVEQIQYVTQDQLKALYKAAEKGEALITPWFRHIVDNFGWKWWDVMLNKGLEALESYVDESIIHRMSESARVEK